MNEPEDRPTRVQRCRVLQVIETRTLAGDGTAANPAHYVIEYWDFDGVRLACDDPWRERAADEARRAAEPAAGATP